MEYPYWAAVFIFYAMKCQWSECTRNTYIYKKKDIRPLALILKKIVLVKRSVTYNI